MLAASAACLAYNVLPRPAPVATVATVAAAHAPVGTVATAAASNLLHQRHPAVRATIAVETDKVALAQEFLLRGGGFYTPAQPDLFAKDFVFRAPVVGPLCKNDYLSTMGLFKLWEALPDMEANDYSWCVDPQDPSTVLEPVGRAVRRGRGHRPICPHLGARRAQAAALRNPERRLGSLEARGGLDTLASGRPKVELSRVPLAGALLRAQHGHAHRPA